MKPEYKIKVRVAADSVQQVKDDKYSRIDPYKIYNAIVCNMDFEIINEVGHSVYCLQRQCNHLNGGDWEIIESDKCSIKLDIIDNDEHVPIEDTCKTFGLTCRKTGVYAGGGWPEYEFIGTREALLEFISSWYATCQEDFCEFVTLIKKVEE